MCADNRGMRSFRPLIACLELVAALISLCAAIWVLSGTQPMLFTGVAMIVLTTLMIFAAFTLVLRWAHAGTLSILSGLTAMIFVTVQSLHLGYMTWLQPFGFVLGLLISMLSLELRNDDGHRWIGDPRRTVRDAP